MLKMTKKSSFIMVIPINNGQMNLKIKFALYCFSVLRNNFLPSFGYYLKGVTWSNLDFYPFQTYTSNIDHFKKSPFPLKICRFPKGLTYENETF